MNHFVDQKANAEISKAITDYHTNEHCRAPHTLLNYRLRYRSFSTASIPEYWKDEEDNTAEIVKEKSRPQSSTKKNRPAEKDKPQLKRKAREPIPELELDRVASRSESREKEKREEEEVQSQRISSDSEETEVEEMDPPQFSAPLSKKQKKGG